MASLGLGLLLLIVAFVIFPTQRGAPKVEPLETMKLPEPKFDGKLPVEGALQKRRSIREYREDPLTLEEISQLLWACQGVTAPEGRRTAPSAGALYPLEISLVVGRVEGLQKGIYKYRPRPHELAKMANEDQRAPLASAALNQEFVRNGAVVLVIAAVYDRTAKQYGSRGARYVHMEAGAAAENVCIQAVSLGLGTVTVAAFNDREVKRTLGLPSDEEPLYLMPIGRTK